MSAPSLMADYAELQAALLERLDIMGYLSSGGPLIFGAQINYLSFDSESGAVSVLVSGPYDKLKKNRGYLYGGTSPVTSSLRLFDAAAKNRPLLRPELRSLNSLLEHLEGGDARYFVYNMGNAIKNIWLDPDAEIEGARDMPWITGMPHGEKLSEMRSDAPYNWPEDMTALGANGSPVSPSAWLRKLGISERPMHQLHTPDNKAWFDYAKAFAASLKKLAIPFDEGQSLQTYRTGSGSSQDSSDPAHSGSFSEAVSDAQADMESKVFTSHNQDILWSYWNASAQATYNNYDEFHNFYVSIYEIKEMAVLLDNFTDLTLDVELYVKSASRCYGDPPYPRAGNDYIHTDYVWDGASPAMPNPDGLFHKIPWASGTIAPGETLFKKQEGSTFIPPAISAPAPPPEGGSSSATIEYGARNLDGLGFWVVTPHFKHLSDG